MTAPSTALVAALALLVADATIELGFITSMVAYLHGGAPSGIFVINTPKTHVAVASADPTYELKGKPLHVLVDQGHTSNGAAGSAIVLIGIVGTIALILRAKFPGRWPTRFLYNFWMIMQIPTLLLTLSALGFVFAVTNKHKGQTINQTVAYDTQPGPYAVDTWTPQNWFAALLQLDFADPALRSNIAMHYRIMRGWQYNLIPMFLLQLTETVLAIVDWWAWRQNGGHNQQHVPSSNEKYESPGDYGGVGNGVQEYNDGNGHNGNFNGQYNQGYANQQQHYTA